jgi:hypothetical protein
MQIFELYYILKTSYNIYLDLLKFSKTYFLFNPKNDILYITEIEDDIILIDI